jgi:hypothetical protein
MVEEDNSGAGRNEIEADEREAMQRLQEEIGHLSVADHVVLMMHSLSSLAIDRLGLTADSVERKDLEQARLAIDAFGALLGTLEGKRPAEEVRAHRSVLSQLQMAYVGALAPAAAPAAGPAPAPGPAEGPGDAS